MIEISQDNDFVYSLMNIYVTVDSISNIQVFMNGEQLDAGYHQIVYIKLDRLHLTVLADPGSGYDDT